MQQHEDNNNSINFSNIIISSSDGQYLQIIKPFVKANGETNYEIIWSPVDGDLSYGGTYNDTKLIKINNKNAILTVRAGKVPQILMIDIDTKKTIWHEDPSSLHSLLGGIHSAAYVPAIDANNDGFVACYPYPHKETGDNLVYINRSNPKNISKIDLADSHGAIWINKNEGIGGGFLWAIGRTTPSCASNSEEGQCILSQYKITHGRGGIELLDTYTLIENPKELSILSWPGWWECPHDIAMYDKNTLWISTELQVIAFDLIHKKVLPTPISRDVFQSIQEIDTPSATNLKSISIKDDCILYVQTLGKDVYSTEFCIIKDKKKYVFKVKNGSSIYKARWA